MKDSFVIVVSGIMGSGKTTLINALHEKLPSKIISFDDYSIDALPSAPPIDTPVKDAVNQYDISALIADLKKFYNQIPFILIDFPFGYENGILAPYIDRVVYIKTPLDICLARQIIRDYQNKTTEEIMEWLKTYITFARPIFLDHENFISNSADLIIDGTLPLADKVNLSLNLIKKKNP
ncbi:adenylylsulfate kinase [Companilactobacillus huachuanensis]|uniref:Adenylylsulfate kinase n=1 Tax=Companilactobacillus huachuanensis TaxID=2559914 RepID=A0ABW1RQD8_9LACO|nr:adenylylsulfate kinase [Companilactobacillus huachuanensis]